MRERLRGIANFIPPARIVKWSPKAATLAVRISFAGLRIDPKARRAIAQIRSRTENDATPFEEDYGGYRTIGEHFRGSTSTRPNLAMLQAVTRWRQPANILEIGTAYGVSAIALAFAQKTPSLVTIECSEQRAMIAARNIEATVSGVECIKGFKQDVLPRLVSEGRRFDLVFHDGGHLGDNYVADFETLLPALGQDAVIIMDNIYHDDGARREYTRPLSKLTCREGWQELVKHRAVEGALVFGRSVGILLLGDKHLAASRR